MPAGASHPDQAWIFGVQPAFLDLGGQDESGGTPHLALPSFFSPPQGGGSCSNIYKDVIGGKSSVR